MSGRKETYQVARVWRQRGILALLAVLFVGSGVLRLGGLDIAQAATDSHADETHGDPYMANAHDDNHMAEDHAGGTHEMCPNVEAVGAALAAIDGRAEELDAREAAIAERQSQLDAAERLITARLAELEAAETRLDALLSVADEAAASDVDQLIAFYEAMGPDDAAELFSEMDPNFAAGFLARMRPESGAGILAELTPELAYAISVILATRNADVPRSSMGAAP